MSQTSQGILLKLLAVALFTPIFAAGKIADGAFSAVAIMSMRYIGGFLTMLVFVSASKTPITALKSPKPSRHFFRACFGVGGGVFIIHASSVMPVANATAIGLAEGVLVIALAGFLLKERITSLHWLAGLIGLLGAGLVVSQSIKITESGFGNWEGIFAATIGAFFMAFEALIIKFLSSKEDAVRMLLYVNGFGALIASILLVVFSGWVAFDNADLWKFLIVGPIAIVSQFFNIRANMRVNASVLAPVSYSWILFAALLGFFMFDEVPSMVTFVGSGLIVAGGVIVSRAR